MTPYTAILRTYRSAPLVFDVIARLKSQRHAPTKIIVVDSGSDADECQRLRALCDEFIDIAHREFNFSYAINVALPRCAGTHALVISSHVLLEQPDLIERAFQAVSQHGAIGFYLFQDTHQDFQVKPIDRASFDGYNGYANACGCLPLAWLTRRNFREEVFSAEDQDWAAWAFSQGASILRIGSRHVRYLNTRVNLQKKLNEEVAIAYFIKPDRLGMPNIFFWLARAAYSMVKLDLEKVRFKLAVAIELFRARSVPPTRSSRYF